ncbi:MAG: outer membrane lipoprotein LolB [Betaproteobacteria bacterium]|nr:outer membrane lipoprotein LolB [Betaproteobacteria bacterium]MBA3775123.1 outer membrane lipoprotein LolB [Betaproteobacteria bacterium]
MLAAALVIAVIGLAACTTLDTVAPNRIDPTARDNGFDIEGRISARRGTAAVASNFAWSHTLVDDRLDFASPLGQIYARVSGNKGGVNVAHADGRTDSYSDWSTLSLALFGLAIPVDGLSAWILGAPRQEQPFTVERDAAGRPSVLRQHGWEIVYAYAAGDAGERPKRLVLRYADTEPIEVRVVIDRWN